MTGEFSIDTLLEIPLGYHDKKFWDSQTHLSLSHHSKPNTETAVVRVVLFEVGHFKIPGIVKKTSSLNGVKRQV